MSDLISRSELLQEFEIETYIHRGGELWHITGIKAMIKNAPAVEAVPVVRCKDCKHWGTGNKFETEKVKCCQWAGYMAHENGYCVYGEKVQDE